MAESEFVPGLLEAQAMDLKGVIALVDAAMALRMAFHSNAPTEELARLGAAMQQIAVHNNMDNSSTTLTNHIANRKVGTTNTPRRSKK